MFHALEGESYHGSRCGLYGHKVTQGNSPDWGRHRNWAGIFLRQARKSLTPAGRGLCFRWCLAEGQFFLGILPIFWDTNRFGMRRTVSSWMRS
jgi:hypothetical protein